MAKTLTVNLTLTLRWNYANTSDLSTATDTATYDAINEQWSNGTGIAQCDLLYHDEITLNGSPQELDLAGVLTDSFGATLTFAKVRGLLVKNLATTGGYNVSVGGAAANGFITPFGDATDKVVAAPNSSVLLLSRNDGFTVAAGTGDLLKLDPGANTINVDVIIFGTSA